MSEVRVKRAYDPPAVDDGFRVLVDGLWPRGLTRDAAQADLWLKEAAPSASLRRWFDHDPAKWQGFQDRYQAELVGNAALDELRALVEGGRRVTLLFGAKDTEHNNAMVLQAICERGPRDAR
ncbi:putative cytosolic protein (plasmid) [Roseomonas mucosa]|uniref:DUF488 domain-containing protein n=1 Tax=Roseomonas mucosa TaxID=207340 RepID=UPI0021FA50F4|nr:DUF488 family protein [Roseomonas mucosa]QDJ11611.1 putative cytosolic protein [Roseomonas mucosa]